MRRLTVALLTIALAGCSRQPPAAQVIDEPPGLEQTVVMGNLNHAKQLTRGFYAIEEGAWRWTKGKFSVVLAPPLQAGSKGATLVARITIPPALIEKLSDVTFNTSVNGLRLKTATYDKPGSVNMRLDVPAKAFEREPATVDFVLDKVLPPRAGDQRELGVIASSIGFERKS
jgi:hypothetical protein